jgi:hypothetical protein
MSARRNRPASPARDTDSSANKDKIPSSSSRNRTPETKPGKLQGHTTGQNTSGQKERLQSGSKRVELTTSKESGQLGLERPTEFDSALSMPNTHALTDLHDTEAGLNSDSKKHPAQDTTSRANPADSRYSGGHAERRENGAKGREFRGSVDNNTTLSMSDEDFVGDFQPVFGRSPYDIKQPYIAAPGVYTHIIHI